MCWQSPNQPRPQKPRTDLRAKKVLYAIAFDAYGLLAQVCVQKSQTVTGKFCSTQVISEVEKRYIERRSKIGARGSKLLHDNASTRRSKSLPVFRLSRFADIYRRMPIFSWFWSMCRFLTDTRQMGLNMTKILEFNIRHFLSNF